MGIGQPSAAIPHLARVAEELPDRADAKVNYGLALQQSGDIGAAMAVQRRAIAEAEAAEMEAQGEATEVEGSTSTATDAAAD